MTDANGYLMDDPELGIKDGYMSPVAGKGKSMFDDVFNRVLDVGQSYLKPSEAEANDKTPPAAAAPSYSERSSDSGTNWLPWIIGGVVLVVVVIGGVLFSRRTA